MTTSKEKVISAETIFEAASYEGMEETPIVAAIIGLSVCRIRIAPRPIAAHFKLGPASVLARASDDFPGVALSSG